MKRGILVSGLLVFLGTAVLVQGGVGGAAAADQTGQATLVKGNNTFAFDLYAKLAPTKDSNLFFSPYSISTALSMAYAGARNSTALQMAQTMHFDLTQAKHHPEVAKITKMFNTGGKSYQLAVANALWAQKGFAFQPEFMSLTKQNYNSGFKEVDFAGQLEGTRKTINQWVEENTQRKIKELIKPKVMNELTRLVLTNAIYFKGKWELQFKPEKTQTQPFYLATGSQQDAALMHQSGKFKYTETNQAQIIELPYTGGDLSMVVVLPKSGAALDQLERTLTWDNLQTWIAGLVVRKVNLFLPRFKMEDEFSLKSTLQRMGMADAFDQMKADFTGISPRFLYIQAVVHKAFVEVNEEGTEAAGATAVVMGTKSLGIDQPVEFRADHPFVFLIRDRRSGSILFLGRIMKP